MRRKALWTISVAVAACIAAFVARSRVETRANSGANEPVLSVEPSFIQMDVDHPDGQVATARITNLGSHSVGLLKITSSCGCTLADPPDQMRLRPGESTVLRIRGTPPGVGTKNTSVQIETDSESTRWLRINLLLKGKELPVPRIAHVPDRIALQVHGQRPDVVTKIFQVDTVERKGTEAWLDRPSDLSGRLTVELEDSNESPGSEQNVVIRSYKYRVAATVDPKDPWELSVSLLTKTDQRIPIRVVAEYAPPFRLVPNTLFLEVASAELDRVKRSVLLVRSDESLTPELQVDAPADDWLTVRRVDSPQSDSTVLARFEVSLASLPPPDARSNRRIVQIRTSHPDCPTIDLPVVIKCRVN